MADFNHTRKVVARKPHACEECRRTIEPGETYERTAAVWEGDFITCVACAHCAAARVICDGLDQYFHEGYYGGLSEWLTESAAEYDVIDGVLRLAAQHSAKWRYQSGALMPCPERAS